jgi:hypothetical protein
MNVDIIPKVFLKLGPLFRIDGFFAAPTLHKVGANLSSLVLSSPRHPFDYLSRNDPNTDQKQRPELSALSLNCDLRGRRVKHTLNEVFSWRSEHHNRPAFINP